VLTGDAQKLALAPANRKSGVKFPEGARVEFALFPAGTATTVGRAAGSSVSAPSVSVASVPGASVRGWVNRAGYDIAVTGETEIGKALRVTRMFGVPALPATAESAAQGTAQIDLRVAGTWGGRIGAASGFPGPQVTGTAKLRNVRIAVRGAGEPVEISSADLQLLPDEVRVEKLSAKAAEASWTGSLEMPRGCGTPGACEVHFNLSANQIGLSEVSAWVNPPAKDRPWYRALESSAQVGTPFLGTVRATGRVTAERFLAHDLVATRVSAKVSLDRGKLQISELSGNLLGGKHRGEWRADFSAKPAVCSGSGSLDGISLAQLADTMKDPWIAGTANASYEVKGTCAADFWPSAEGTLRFEVRDGTLPHIALAEDAGGLKVTRFSGKAGLQAGKIEIKDAKLDSPSGIFLVNGTASLKRELDVKLARTPSGAAGYAISGTLAEPRVTRSGGAETQARLKTDPSK